MSLPAILTVGFAVTSATGAALLDHEIPQKASRLLDRSVYQGPRHRKVVALTFDDGPSPQTPAVLALLARSNIRATFFQTGLQVQRQPSLAREVSAAGHEVGNHGWSHRSLRPHLRRPFSIPSPRLLHRELARTQQLLTAVHGEAPRWFRPPFGHRWLLLDAIQRRLGLRAAQWSVIGHDWEWSADRIAQRIAGDAFPGAILCLHDGRDLQPTADLSELLGAMEQFVPRLQAEGYQFATMTELMSTLLPTPPQEGSANRLMTATADLQ